MTMTMTLGRLLWHSGWRTPAAALSAALGLSLTFSLGLLAGCGGGGGGNATPSNPVAAVTVGISATPTATTVGQPITLTWTTTNASAGSCAASGAWSGALATSGSQVVTAGSAGSAAYTITCSGVASTASVTIGAAPVLPSGANTAPIVLDSGPEGTGNALNEPFVSVTVCRPGTTVCQTIDHVLLDTGSTGLRLIGPLSSTLALPAVTTPSGAAAAECIKFADGYTWGSVQQADVQIGGEQAAAVSLQLIGDPAGNFARVPASCSNGGANIGTVAKLGAKGVLGVGLFKQDCGSGCVNDSSANLYYACTASGSCSATTMALAQQVSNPVASFATDNNGVLIVLPSVPTAGAATLTGSLVFGVNTQSNNALAGAAIYRADNGGNFVTTYKGKTLSNSFIDSGSNGLFFDDSAITNCSQNSGFYCPATTLSLSAVNTGVNGSASGTVNFIVVNEQNLDDSIVAASIGGTAGSSLNGSFDWGLPFFFGRRVFVVIEGDSAGGAVGPYWAY